MVTAIYSVGSRSRTGRSIRVPKLRPFLHGYVREYVYGAFVRVRLSRRKPYRHYDTRYKVHLIVRPMAVQLLGNLSKFHATVVSQPTSVRTPRRKQHGTGTLVLTSHNL